jgi:hypothetical protein
MNPELSLLTPAANALKAFSLSCPLKRRISADDAGAVKKAAHWRDYFGKGAAEDSGSNTLSTTNQNMALLEANVNATIVAPSSIKKESGLSYDQLISTQVHHIGAVNPVSDMRILLQAASKNVDQNSSNASSSSNIDQVLQQMSTFIRQSIANAFGEVQISNIVKWMIGFRASSIEYQVAFPYNACLVGISQTYSKPGNSSAGPNLIWQLFEKSKVLPIDNIEVAYSTFSVQEKLSFYAVATQPLQIVQTEKPTEDDELFDALE